MNKVELKVNHLIKTTNNSVFYREQDITYLNQYLLNLGINANDIPSFIDRPRDTDEDNPLDLLNMKKAVETAWYQLNKGVKVVTIVDSDTDGYTSSAILLSYIKERFPNVETHFVLHPGKEHGIVLEDIKDDIDLVFVPDAGSNNYDEQEALINKGKTVIILDHHEVDNYRDTGAILVNNQFSPNFSNKNMSGAGIVYMFIKQMDSMYWPDKPIYQNYRDLAAIGIIADAMKMTSLGNNYLAFHGLHNIRNKFIKALAQRQSHGIKDPNNLTKIDVAFYIAPTINGVVRSGTMEDKSEVFVALSTPNSTEEIAHTWRGNTTYETIYERAARIASNAKNRQDAAKKKSFEWLCAKIKEEGKDKDNLIIAAIDSKDSAKVSPTITGLIAMELVREFNRPALVLRRTFYDNQDMFGGSGRNGNFYGLPDLKAFIKEAGAYYAEGHANAFGAFLLPDQVDKIRDYANSHLDAGAFESVFEVDYWFKHKSDVDMEMLYQFASHEDLWGNSIPQPKFAFTVDYTKTDILIMGKDRSSVKIKCGTIDLVTFKNPKLAQTLIEHPYGQLTAVGRPQLNKWNGSIGVQIIIDDIEITPAEKVPQQPQSLFDLI